MDARVEHPHRCAAGHRWQHAGESAVTCEIPAYDPVTGELPFVSATDCPVCSGRQDLLVRGLHPHYCNLCDGDWDHEGVCVNSLAAYCPWCFPTPDSPTPPGARRGPHYHFCSECGHNWQHEEPCSAPLRAALPECTACRTAPVERDAEWRPELVPPAPVRCDKTLRRRMKPRALPIGIAAAVLLAIPIGLKGYSALRSAAVSHNASVVESRLSAPKATPPETAPTVASPAPPPNTLAPTVESSGVPGPTVRAPKPTPTAPVPGAIRPTPAAPAPDAAKQSAERRVAPSVLASKPQPAPRSSSAAASKPSEPRRDAPTEPRARPAAAAPDVTGDFRAAQSTPAPPAARSEVAVKPVTPTFEAPPVVSESAVRGTPVAAPAVPGAPVGGLTGGSARDTSLEGHPRRVIR